MNIYLIHLLIKLKNASLVKKESITLLYSKQGLHFIKLLYVLHIIQAFYYNPQKDLITILFKVYLNKLVFENLEFISIPSNEKFLTFKSLCRLQLQTKKSFLLSTDGGYMTESACKKSHKGGKVLFLY